MGGYYDRRLSEGAVVTPVFRSSTYGSQKMIDLAASFNGGSNDLLYARLNAPNGEIFEERFKHWDGAEGSVLFASGMAVISATFREFLSQGDIVLFSEPLYGCTDKMLRKKLPQECGIIPVGFSSHDVNQTILEKVGRVMRDHPKSRVGMIFVETPANPTIELFDLEMCSILAQYLSEKGRRPLFVVDNTFLGPLFQQPLKHGADLVVYSATKYIGGHSDLMGGICAGSAALVKRLKERRALEGNMPDADTVWLLERSLKTLKIRMLGQQENAKYIAEFLYGHPAVERVYYPLFFESGGRQSRIFKRQCLGHGAMISFDLKCGDEAVTYKTKTNAYETGPRAFVFLDALQIIVPVVSLGSVESLAQHPARLTHALVPTIEKMRLGITDKMIRLSVGLEHRDDIIADLSEALEVYAMHKGA